MKPTVPANFPVRQGESGLSARSRQPQARAVAMSQAMRPLQGAGAVPGRFADAARASLEAVQIFWQNHAARGTGGKSPK